MLRRSRRVLDLSHSTEKKEKQSGGVEVFLVEFLGPFEPLRDKFRS